MIFAAYVVPPRIFIICSQKRMAVGAIRRPKGVETITEFLTVDLEVSRQGTD